MLDILLFSTSIIPNRIPGTLLSFSLHWSACHSFFPSHFNIIRHLHYFAHFYPENAGSMFFLNSRTHPPDYLSQSIKSQHESSLLRNSKSHKIISTVRFNGTHQLQINRILIYTVLLCTVLWLKPPVWSLTTLAPRGITNINVGILYFLWVQTETGISILLLMTARWWQATNRIRNSMEDPDLDRA